MEKRNFDEFILRHEIDRCMHRVPFLRHGNADGMGYELQLDAENGTAKIMIDAIKPNEWIDVELDERGMPTVNGERLDIYLRHMGR